MFRRFGSEVTIIENGPRLIPREDEDVSAAILDILQREGIQVRLGTKCKSFARQGDEIVASVDGPPARALKSAARTCCSRSGGVRIPTIWDSKRREWRSIPAGTFWSTISSAPTFPASGRWGLQRQGRVYPHVV